MFDRDLYDFRTVEFAVRYVTQVLSGTPVDRATDRLLGMGGIDERHIHGYTVGECQRKIEAAVKTCGLARKWSEDYRKAMRNAKRILENHLQGELTHGDEDEREVKREGGESEGENGVQEEDDEEIKQEEDTKQEDEEIKREEDLKQEDDGAEGIKVKEERVDDS